MHLYSSVYFHATDLVETLFKIILNTLVTKYTDNLIFSYPHEFNFQLSTYHLSSALHNATLIYVYGNTDRTMFRLSS